MASIYLGEELEAFRIQIDAFLAREVLPFGEKWEREGMVPREVLRRLGALGFLGLRIPEDHGGVGLGPLASAMFSEALGSSTFGGFEVTVLVHTDMAAPHLIQSPNQALRERHLGAMASGERISAIAVSEPDAGSDVAGMRTQAVRERGGWRIDGSKLFITNGVHADLLFVAARTDPANSHGLSIFLVERGTPGLAVSRKLEKTGWLCSDTAELSFASCWVPDENLVGTLHRGFYEIMRGFQNERLVISGMAVGASQKALDLTLGWVQQRKAFGGVLWDKQAIRQRLALLQARVDAARQYLYHCAWLMEQATDATREVSGLKALSCELVNEVTYACVQFHGGLGYMRESTIERMARDARVMPIGGGATEVMLDEVAKRMRA
jgi:acyl-CoA dehydrogenase